MILSLSHDASIVGSQNVFAFVEVSPAILCAPVSSFADRDAANASVDGVDSSANRAKVGDSVVSFIAINVVNHVRLFASRNKVRNPVGEVADLFVSQPVITSNIRASDQGAGSSRATQDCPSQIARVGIVMKDIAYRIGYKFHSHLKLPLHLVRGAVVGATVTPTLTWEFPLAK
jgi:hypothetical protein